MRFLSIDNYLADLNVLVDELGGAVDLVGLCQGGWMALVYAARFPAKIRKLVLAGAPIDIAAGASSLSARRAIRRWLSSGNWSNSAADAFSASMHCGFGNHMHPTERQSVNYCSAPPERARERFEAGIPLPRLVCTDLALPGTYYLQVVERLFKDNRLMPGPRKLAIPVGASSHGRFAACKIRSSFRRLKKISGASRRGSLTFCNNFAVCSFSAKT